MRRKLASVVDSQSTEIYFCSHLVEVWMDKVLLRRKSEPEQPEWRLTPRLRWPLHQFCLFAEGRWTY